MKSEIKKVYFVPLQTYLKYLGAYKMTQAEKKYLKYLDDNKM